MDQPQSAETKLDDDLLVLDYLLYHVLKSFFRSADNTSAKSAKERIEAYDSKLRSFDLFMQNFRAAHPYYELRLETRWSIRLLELVILLQQQRQYSTRRKAYESAICDESRGLELEEQQEMLQQRRAWCQARSCSTPSSKQDVDLEEAIFRSWEEPKSATGPSSNIKQQQNRPPPLVGVLHRFMELSAEISELMMRPINMKMMTTTRNIILQTALQVLSSSSSPQSIPPIQKPKLASSSLPSPPPSSSSSSSPAEDTLANHPDMPTPTLRDVFAYGYVDERELEYSRSSLSSFPLVEDPTTRMFSYMPGDTGVEDDDTYRLLPRAEIPEWTELRHNTICEFHISSRSSSMLTTTTTTTTTGREKARATRVERLKEKYPYPPVEVAIIHCLKDFWRLQQDDVLYGKPVLVKMQQDQQDTTSPDTSPLAVFLGRYGFQIEPDDNDTDFNKSGSGRKGRNGSPGTKNNNDHDSTCRSSSSSLREKREKDRNKRPRYSG